MSWLTTALIKRLHGNTTNIMKRFLADYGESSTPLGTPAERNMMKRYLWDGEPVARSKTFSSMSM
jgi:hypothetical protein